MQLHRVSPLFTFNEEKGRGLRSKPLETFCVMPFLSRKKYIFSIESATI